MEVLLPAQAGSSLSLDKKQVSVLPARRRGAEEASRTGGSQGARGGECRARFGATPRGGNERRAKRFGTVGPLWVRTRSRVGDLGLRRRRRHFFESVVFGPWPFYCYCYFAMTMSIIGYGPIMLIFLFLLAVLSIQWTVGMFFAGMKIPE